MSSVAEVKICAPNQTDTANPEIEVCREESAEVNYEINVCREETDPCPGEEAFGYTEIGGNYFLTGGVAPYYRWDDSNNAWVKLGGSVVLPTDPVDCPENYLYRDLCFATLEYGPPANETTALTLTGTDEPEVGDGYSASGGVPPYSYSISCGVISSAGTITSLTGCCGSGEVTVSDQCGSQASISVRFPSGSWDTIEYWYDPVNSSCSGTWESSQYTDIIVGDIKTRYRICCLRDDYNSNTNYACGDIETCCLNCSKNDLGYPTGSNDDVVYVRVHIFSKTIMQWVC